ncbi:ATP-dependent zinc metalloprotease FtsH [Stieleria varia]|uniref:ATP-dependent zinc metalloprotease FtsH n=1 Tax=Stieleria varia TaxID=2528005 RepID=A0A5C6APD6_9BACT|nr:ATP-dependent zinc metalloprotease FtsH [Stieleria varia]TWU01139.1 ATP-dependent zinc metalloprotease FtsH 4 [Stieleria varia]
MSDDQRKKDSNRGEGKGNETRGSGSVVFVLIAVVCAIVASAFLMGNNTNRIRYPDLERLLREHAETLASSNPTNRPKIETASTQDPAVVVEYSDLQSVLLGDETITGTVMYRKLGTAGKDRSNAENVPKLVKFSTIRVRNDAQDASLNKLLIDSGVQWDNARPNRWLADHWLELMMVAAVILLGVIMLRRIGGMGSPMSFSRSRGKLHGQEDLSISFEDAAGIDEAVEEVREVVDFLKNSEKYQALGGRIPKGVLLVGPPGTGKTLLAKAIAGEAGVPFFSLSGSDFVEMFVGVGAARVRDMFQQAVSRAPCIIFIDELDALGKSRSGSVVGGHDEREQTLNALLVEMDGFDSNSGVIVIAATNRPETLDAALLRPGRFDRHVLVDRPDVAGREAILKVHVRSVRLADDVDLRHIASITSGFVGADLANLVNEAALLAARGDKTSVSTQEFDEAVERVTAGLEKKNRVMNEDEKIRVAYHEAGHALVAAALPNTDPVHKVSIIPRGIAALGYTMQRPESERYLMTKTELESRMKVLLAGTLTEEMIFQDISTGAQNDLERCSEIARSMVMDYGMSRLGRLNFRRSTRSPFLAGGGGNEYQFSYGAETAKMIDKEVARIVEDALTQTREILSQRREVLEAVTQRLLEVEAIDNTELNRLIQQHTGGPWLVPGTVTEKPRAQIRTDETDAQRNASAT